uniref:Putative ixodes 10 kDa peptide protein n=1 Tax=Ixodes ricinus TaxID=34613 RepID=A0A0K8RIQ1_IXORI
MCRNISNMLFVLFAVVLGLAASEGESDSPTVDKSWLALSHKGDLYCQFFGYDKFGGLSLGLCELGCGGSEVPLPKEACPSSMNNPCTDEDVERLQRWADTLESQKAKVQEKLCK